MKSKWLALLTQNPPTLNPVQVVRDLKWAIQSPNLLSSDDFVLEPEWIDTHIDGQHLVDFLRAHWNHRVGYYFESLTRYWLAQLRGVDELSHRVQIRTEDNKRTLGELDFLFRDESGVWNHLETAVKFYLHYAPHHHSGSHFIGPNAADNFERKLVRMTNHQLPLSAAHFPHVRVRQALVKGRIFFHPTDSLEVELPESLSKSHLRGTWMWFHEFPTLADSERNYRVLQKPFWLAPGSQEPASDHLTFASIDRALKDPQGFASTPQYRARTGNSTHPVLLSVLDAKDGSEVDRMFVVPSDWPNTQQ